METFDHHDTPIDVWKTDDLQSTLQLFIASCQHLAFVKEPSTRTIAEHDGATDVADKVQYQYVGIITMEDVMEEILRREVADEYDDFEDNLEDKSLWRKRSNLSAKKRRKTEQRHPSMPQMEPVPVILANGLNAESRPFLATPHWMDRPFMPSTTPSAESVKLLTPERETNGDLENGADSDHSNRILVVSKEDEERKMESLRSKYESVAGSECGASSHSKFSSKRQNGTYSSVLEWTVICEVCTCLQDSC